MRLYKRSKAIDLKDTIGLAQLDADFGRVRTALDRLADLADELGDDAMICYAEGLIRRDFLGQGFEAHRCFKRALELDPTHGLSACNATLGAPSEQKFRRFAEIACRLSPDDADGIRESLGQFEDNNFANVACHQAFGYHEQKHFGSCAALLEISLTCQSADDSTEEAKMRRWRAESLRHLDRQAAAQSQTWGEALPGRERMALREAKAEIERALKLDEFDAEMWNLKAAWCIELGLHSEAVESADRAIALRPNGYPKPYRNKAVALKHQHKKDEALVVAERGRQEALSINSPSEIAGATSLIDEISNSTMDLSDESILSSIRQVCKGMEVRTHHFAGVMKCTVQDLYDSFVKRLAGFSSTASLEYVAPIGQLLAYVPTEAAFCILRRLAGSEKTVRAYELCLEALCYAVIHSESVMQKDAARVAALLVCDETTISAMAFTWQSRFRGPAQMDPEGFGELQRSVETALGEINIHLPITLRFKPVMENFSDRIQQARPERIGGRTVLHIESSVGKITRGMLARLDGTPSINDSSRFIEPASVKAGCNPLLLFFVVLVVATALYRFLH